MSLRHVVRRAADASFAAPTGWAAGATGYGRWSIVDESVPNAVHTGFSVSTLDGAVPAHVHSYEESVYVLAGQLTVDVPGGSVLLTEGDYGMVPAGVPHALRGAGARWAEMLAPQPRSRHDDDTLLAPAFPTSDAVPVDPRDPTTRRFGHISPGNMDATKQSQEMLAVSASMRTALLVYSGITVKMMVDGDLGARLSTMFMVQYAPDGKAGAHDHPFEETYLILEGATHGTFDGESYRLEVGDIAWAGVGCVHSFTNAGDGVVRWLETQAPQPPSRHSYRFARDWDYLRARLDQGSTP